MAKKLGDPGNLERPVGGCWTYELQFIKYFISAGNYEQSTKRRGLTTGLPHARAFCHQRQTIDHESVLHKI